MITSIRSVPQPPLARPGEPPAERPIDLRPLVGTQLTASRRVNAIPFDADSSVFARAVAERQLTQADLDRLAGSDRRSVRPGQKPPPPGDGGDTNLRRQAAAAIGADYFLELDVRRAERDGVARLLSEVAFYETSGRLIDRQKAEWTVGGSPDDVAATAASTLAARFLDGLRPPAAGPVAPADAASAVVPPAPGLPAAGSGQAEAEGDRARAEGNLPAAILAYRRAVDLAPDSVPARSKLAAAYLERGMLEQAESQAARAVELAGDDPAALAAYGRVLVERKRWPEAEATLRRAVAAAPDDLDVRLALADVLVQLRKADEAEALLSGLARGDGPAAEAALRRLAAVLAGQGRFAESLELIARVQAGADGDDAPLSYADLTAQIDPALIGLLDELGTLRTRHARGEMTREQFFNRARALAGQADSLSGFLDKLTVGPDERAAHKRRSYAAALAAQAAGALLSYIETNDPRHLDELLLLRAEARRGLAAIGAGR